MDKETLSNYGWIVVLVLILAVMMALATPFGSFVSTAIKDVTGGFWNVNSVALKGVGISTEDVDFPAEPASCGVEGHYIGDDKGEHGIPVEDCKSGHTYTCECDSWIVPTGGKYYAGVTSTTLGDYTGATKVYNAGEKLPCGYVSQTGDTYVDKDYEYKYNGSSFYSDWNLNETQNGWGVKVINKNQKSYDIVLSNINNQNINTLRYTFQNCYNLITAPKIPNTTTDMCGTFECCFALTDAPAIPDGVKDLEFTFANCFVMVNAPIIPSTVENMHQTFYNCYQITTVSPIHNSVTDMRGAFQCCTSLTGTIEIDANPSVYSDCFRGTDFQTQNITLTGTSTMLDEIGATGTNYCATCNGTCSGTH